VFHLTRNQTNTNLCILVEKRKTAPWSENCYRCYNVLFVASFGPVGNSVLLTHLVKRQCDDRYVTFDCTASYESWRRPVFGAAASTALPPTSRSCIHDRSKTTRVMPNEFWLRDGRRCVRSIYIIIFVLF